MELINIIEENVCDMLNEACMSNDIYRIKNILSRVDVLQCKNTLNFDDAFKICFFNNYFHIAKMMVKKFNLKPSIMKIVINYPDITEKEKIRWIKLELKTMNDNCLKSNLLSEVIKKDYVDILKLFLKYSKKIDENILYDSLEKNIKISKLLIDHIYFYKNTYKRKMLLENLTIVCIINNKIELIEYLFIDGNEFIDNIKFDGNEFIDNIKFDGNEFIDNIKFDGNEFIDNIVNSCFIHDKPNILKFFFKFKFEISTWVFESIFESNKLDILIMLLENENLNKECIIKVYKLLSVNDLLKIKSLLNIC